VSVEPLLARTPRRPSVRLLLNLIMVGLVVAVSSALIGLGYYRAREAAIDSAQQRMSNFADKLTNRMTILSSDTSTLIGLLSSVGNSFLSAPNERMKDKVNALREVLLRSPHIDGVYAGYANGSFFHVLNLTSKGWRKVLKAPPTATLAVRTIERSENGPAVVHLIFFDGAGNQLPGEQTSATDFDPRTRPWYPLATGSNRPIVVGPYPMAATNALGITIAQAHKDDHSTVIAADVIMGTVTDFLTTVPTPNSVAFIVDGYGRPIVHSNPQAMKRILESMSGRDTSRFPDALTESLKDFHGKTGQIFLQEADGKEYVVLATTIESTLLFSHRRLFVAAPLEELTEGARANVIQSLLIAAAIVGLVIIGALVLAGMVSRPLHQLTSSANRFASFDFQTPIEVQTSVREISTLSHAMNSARNAIFTFSLYVPKELVRKGMQSEAFSRRTAERHEVTAIFTDIYDFTTISERYPPEDVVNMLSVYFDILNRIVSAHNGTIIQFLGDSIFAMWNAPVADDKHAEHACRAALAMQQGLEEFNADQRSKGLPEFRTRFGIHTGTAVVGSVGAAERLQYTAMGDTINVASRLEGMNKTYGTTILASADVKARCQDTVVFKSLGKGRAKGRIVAVELFEVVGSVNAEEPALVQMGEGAA
jgi:adenylate cyclase